MHDRRRSVDARRRCRRLVVAREMIDRSWLTAAELEVLRDALERHRVELEATIRHQRSLPLRQDARWQLHVTAELLVQLSAK